MSSNIVSASLDDAGGHDDEPDDGFEVGVFDELLQFPDETVHGLPRVLCE